MSKEPSAKGSSAALPCINFMFWSRSRSAAAFPISSMAAVMSRHTTLRTRGAKARPQTHVPAATSKRASDGSGAAQATA